MESVGLWDYLYDDGVCAIEWADRIRESLPQEVLWVTLRHYLDRRPAGHHAGRLR